MTTADREPTAGLQLPHDPRTQELVGLLVIGASLAHADGSPSLRARARLLAALPEGTDGPQRTARLYDGVHQGLATEPDGTGPTHDLVHRYTEALLTVTVGAPHARRAHLTTLLEVTLADGQARPRAIARLRQLAERMQLKPEERARFDRELGPTSHHDDTADGDITTTVAKILGAHQWHGQA